MARFYTESPVPTMGTTYSSSSSNQIRPLDLARIHSDSNSIFTLTLAASNHSIPATPSTPTTLWGLPYSSPIVPLNHRLYSVFADPEETPNRGVPVWPSGLEYDDNDGGEHSNKCSITRSRTGSSSYHGQAVEIHHGAAKVKAWVRKTFSKIIPERKRRLGEGDSSRERMILD
ncbi:hypothetical protein FRC04_010160 [Tulasnella sp. 424]|nr:hypothetical protein FRC04_010160 [Tulasnella sp. 424]KAG8972566.1 hypothetical protein FRC05_009799 [Tulasnella sp. 425]